MKILRLILILIISLSAWAEEGKGPYSKKSKASLAQKIIHVLDNSTVGIVQTVLGAGHVLVFGILNPINNEDFSVDGFNNETGEVSQFVVHTPAFNANAYSLGLFQVGGTHGAHEGGHSVASATLGPLYLPTVGLSYLFESYGGSSMETWADLESAPSEYMNTESAEVGIGQTILDGEVVNVVVFKFSIEQRQLMENYRLKSDKIFQWLNTKIVMPLLRNNSVMQTPVLLEIDLLKKTLNLLSGNIFNYLHGDQQIRSSILTEQRYLHIEQNQVLKKIHLRALDWSAQFGIQYNLNKNFSVTPRIGGGVSVGILSQDSSLYDSMSLFGKFDFAATASVKGSVEMKFFDYVTFTSTLEKEWYYTNGISKLSFSNEITNSFRNPCIEDPIQFLDFGAGYKMESWDGPQGRSTLNQLNATFGFRF